MLLWDYSPKTFQMRVALCRMMAKGSFFFNFVASLILVLTDFGHDFGDEVRYSRFLFWEADLQKLICWGTTPGKLTWVHLVSPKKPSPNFSFSGVENHPKKNPSETIRTQNFAVKDSRGDGNGIVAWHPPK